MSGFVISLHLREHIGEADAVAQVLERPVRPMQAEGLQLIGDADDVATVVRSGGMEMQDDTSVGVNAFLD